MSTKDLQAIDLVEPIKPFNKLEPVLVAGDDKFAMEGDAELPMDHKVQGKYGGICRVISTHAESDLGLEKGDLVIIWDTAIAPFELPRGSGELLLIKDADIFAKVPNDVASEFLKKLDINE